MSHQLETEINNGISYFDNVDKIKLIKSYQDLDLSLLLNANLKTHNFSLKKKRDKLLTSILLIGGLSAFLILFILEIPNTSRWWAVPVFSILWYILEMITIHYESKNNKSIFKIIKGLFSKNEEKNEISLDFYETYFSKEMKFNFVKSWQQLHEKQRDRNEDILFKDITKILDYYENDQEAFISRNSDNDSFKNIKEFTDYKVIVSTLSRIDEMIKGPVTQKEALKRKIDSILAVKK